MNHRYPACSHACGTPVAAALSAVLLSQLGVAVAASANPAAAQPAAQFIHTAQLPRYSASGRHQCGSGNDPKRSCVVTGLFNNCNDASIGLKTRDCCPTTPGGGTSTAFAMTYCIPDVSGR